MGNGLRSGDGGVRHRDGANRWRRATDTVKVGGPAKGARLAKVRSGAILSFQLQTRKDGKSTKRGRQSRFAKLGAQTTHFVSVHIH